jgi:GxxExxY protein
MPIHVDAPIRRLSQQEFGDLAYRVMDEVFHIHAEMGRFFEEMIYKEALAIRFPNVRLEVAVIVTHKTFRKRYALDVLIGDGGLFEFKAADALSPRNRAQLTNYLLLCDLAHGKLVNLRPPDVEHEFVNALTPRETRREFVIDSSRWKECCAHAGLLRQTLIDLLHDWGTGLELPLYEEALTHFLGGEAAVVQKANVFLDGLQLGRQPFRVAAPNVAFKLTAFDGPLEPFDEHAQLLLQHTSLSAILWANVSLKRATFITLEK